MLGLLSLEVNNSIFNIIDENNKFEHYLFPHSKNRRIKNKKVRDEIEMNLEISDITATDLPDEKLGPTFIEQTRREVSKGLKTDIYKDIDILAGNISSIFQDFESYLRTEVDLVEDDIRLVLDESNSSFITYEVIPGIYTFKDLSELLNLKESTTPLLFNLTTLA